MAAIIKRSQSGGFWGTASTSAVIAVIGFATGTLAARILGATGRGELAAIQIWPTFLSSIALLGIPDALVYFSAREPERTGRQIGSAFAVTSIVSLILVAVGYAVLPLLLHTHGPDTIRGARLYLWSIPITSLIYVAHQPFRGHRQFHLWNMIRVLPPFGWLAVLIGGRALGLATPSWLASRYMLALAAVAAVVWVLARIRFKGSYKADFGCARALVGYGAPCVLGSVSQMLNLRMDQMLMAGLFSAHDLGLYVAAVAWANCVLPMMNAMSSVFMPRLAAIQERERQFTVFAQGARLAIVVATIIGVSVAAATHWMFPLVFGIQFAAAVPAAYVLVAGAAVAGFNAVMEDGLRGLGRPDAVMKAESIGLVCTAGFLLLLLRPLGILGAAIASAGAYSIVGVVLILQAARHTRSSGWLLLKPDSRELYHTCSIAFSRLPAIVRHRTPGNNAQLPENDERRRTEVA